MESLDEINRWNRQMKLIDGIVINHFLKNNLRKYHQIKLLDEIN